MRKTFLWLACAAFFLFALVCLMAIVQAGSLYVGERARWNLQFWGSLALANAVGSLVCAALAWRARPRQGAAPPQ